jgi:hypothetical protein
MLIIFASVHAKHPGASIPSVSDFYQMMSDEAALQLAAEALDPAKDARLKQVQEIYKLEKHDRFRDGIVDNLRNFKPKALLPHQHALIDNGYIAYLDITNDPPDVIERLRAIAADPASPDRFQALQLLVGRSGTGDDLYEAFLDEGHVGEQVDHLKFLVSVD